MASTYTTNSGIEKPASGEQSGAWGATVNTNMDIIDTLVSGFISITAGSTSVTLTTTDGSVTAGMNRAIKYVDGGDLGGDCTVTFSPNDQEKLIFVENGLSASRSLIFSQGSGANFTLQNGKQALIRSDGAGSGAAVYGVLANLEITTLEVTGAAAIDGALTAGGGVAVTGNVTATGPVEPAGDTSAADNAAIGYTSVEGLILTGQGSSGDVTIKNDADGKVMEVLTGTTTAAFAGDLTVGGTAKIDTITAVSTNADLSLDGLGTGGVSIASTLKMAKGGDISSASPLVIDTDGNYFDVTGTTNFAAMTVEAGNFFMLQFDGVLTITHGSGIEIPGAANLTTAAGDRIICYATAANTVEVMNVATEAAGGGGDLEAANNLSDVASAATSYGNIKQAASTTATGAIEIATDAETNTGTATDRAITPANLTQRAMLQGEKELWIPAGAMIPRVTNGPSSGLYESSTNKLMSRTLDFDASTSEYAQFNVAFPNSWNEGTITSEFYWTATSGSGNVLWGIAGVAVADDGILDASFGTRQTIVDALTATGDLMKSAATSAVTIKDTPADGKMTYFQMDRDADDGSDTFSADARLVGITIRYTVNVGNDA